MTQLLTPGQNTTMNITRPNGALVFVVLISLFTDGVSLTFNHHPILNRSFNNLTEGRAYLRFLIAEAAAGTPMWLIVERAGAWTSAAAAMDDAERHLVDGINAAINGRIADSEARAAAEHTAVADIPHGTVDTDGWRRMRNEARAALGRPVRPTRTRVHVQPPTLAQLDRMRAHHNGRVTVADRQSWTLLDGIVQRRLADPTTVEYWPGTQKIRAVWLNGRGLAAIGERGQVAA